MQATTKTELSASYKTSLDWQIKLKYTKGLSNHYISLGVNDKKLQCHSVILAAKSPVFESLLQHDFQEKRHYFINLTITLKTSKNLVNFINYLYGEAMHLTKNNVYIMLDMASQYFLDSLTKQCEDFLFKNLCAENLSSVWYAAELFHLKGLRHLCKFFARETLGINPSYFCDIIRGGPTWFVSSLVRWSQEWQLDGVYVVNALEQWLQDDFAARRDAVSDLLKTFKLEDIVPVLSSRLQQSRPLQSNARDYVNLVLRRFFGSDLPEENPSNPCQTRMNHITYYLQERNSKDIVFYCFKTNTWRTMKNPRVAGELVGVLPGDSFVYVEYCFPNNKISIFNLPKEEHKKLPQPFLKLEADGYNIMAYVQGASYFINNGTLFFVQAVESNRKAKESSPEIVLYRFSVVSQTWSYVKSLPLDNKFTFKCLHSHTFTENRVVIIVTVLCNQIKNYGAGFEENSILHVLDSNTEPDLIPITVPLGLTITKRNIALFGDYLQFITEMSTENIHGQPHCISVNLRDGSVSQTSLPPPWNIISSFPQLKHHGRLNELFPRHNIRFMDHNICSLSHIAPSMLTVLLYDFYKNQWKITPPIPLPGIDKVTLHHCYTYKPISDIIAKQRKSIPKKLRCFSDSELVY